MDAVKHLNDAIDYIEENLVLPLTLTRLPKLRVHQGITFNDCFMDLPDLL